jgi:hypothetical protein
MPSCPMRLLYTHKRRKRLIAHFMPRQLRGPFEKVTNQLSNARESGWSHRSGRKSYGRTKISSEKLTKRGLWLTTVCLIRSGTSRIPRISWDTNPSWNPNTGDHRTRRRHHTWQATRNRHGKAQRLLNHSSLFQNSRYALTSTQKKHLLGMEAFRVLHNSEPGQD